MFSNFGIKICNKFLNSEEYRSLSTKRERIHHILSRFDLNQVIKMATKIIDKANKCGSKCSDESEHYLHCAELIYQSMMIENTSKTIENVNKVCDLI